jgi:CRISPR-associated exonuclease Cas4
VEERMGSTPPYGLLRYADATIKIPFSETLRVQVIEAAEAIRRHQGAADLARSHQETVRCTHCGYRHACGKQALGVRQ